MASRKLLHHIPSNNEMNGLSMLEVIIAQNAWHAIMMALACDKGKNAQGWFIRATVSLATICAKDEP